MNERGARQKPIAIAWTGDGLIGRLTIGGELWAAVEWSEKRQRWCIEDAAGRCLSHHAHIHGAEASKEAAVALAEAMIRDGQMPAPETARENRKERLRVGREKRQRQPAEIRKRERTRRWSDASLNAWRAKCEEDKAPPLYETLADVFDFADPELWKSNSFASLRPRLAVHVRAVIAKLESDLALETRRSPQPFCGLSATMTRAIEAKLARAREILGRLDPEGVS